MIAVMTMASTHQTAKPSQRAPAVFLDRDGTINVEKEYLHRIEDWEWIAGAPEAIRQFNQAGFKVVVVSNQAGIARGMYSPADVNNLHAFVSRDLQKSGATIDAFYYCPHHPEYGEERSCSCRKPAPGLLLRAAADMSIDLSRSWMIGDKLIDVEAGHAANVATILVLTGHGAREIARLNHGQIVADNLLLACRHILLSLGSRKAGVIQL